MKEEEVVKDIRDSSVKRPQRVVIDEELPDNRYSRPRTGPISA